MKKILSVTCLISGILLGANIGAAPVAGSSSAGASVGGTIPSVTPAVPGTAPRTLLPPDNRTQPPLNQSATDTVTTNPVNPNQLGALTNNNQIQDNNLSATANANDNNNLALRGRAVTPSDRILLQTLNQSIAAQLGVTTERAIPVRFFINNGAVTLVGVVPNSDESQRIMARVQQTPGVLSVFNDLRVGTPNQTVVPQSSIAGATTDHAFSPADNTVLTAVQQAAGLQLGITSASAAQMPVHFSVEHGVVGVTGQVGSLQEKRALIAAAQRVSGVTRVVDNITIANGADGSLSGSTGNLTPSQNNNLPATSRDLNQSNSIFMNSTNSPGF